MANALTGKWGSLWLQADGANGDLELLDCVEFGDLALPEGEIETLRCFNVDGTGWVDVGEKRAVPDDISFSAEALLFPDQRDKLQQIRWPFALYILQRDGGRADVFTNYRRGDMITGCRRVSVTKSNLVNRAEENESLVSIEGEARRHYPIEQLEAVALPSGTTLAISAIAMNTDERSPASEQGRLDKGDVGVFVTAAPGGGSGQVSLTSNAGATWVSSGAPPFGSDESIAGQVRFSLGRDKTRLLVAKAAPDGAQGAVAYSDDGGANWTTVNIGGALAGHGPVGPGGLFALDHRHIWLASAAGYIYFSDDGGESWRAQEAGTLTTGPYHAIHFYSAKYGVAGAAADILAVTGDGGASWQAATALGGGADILAVAQVGPSRLWAGTAEGKLYASANRGGTWAQRTGWADATIERISGFHWLDEYVGFIVVNKAGPAGQVYRTFTGGREWEEIALPANSGLSAVFAVAPGSAWVVGAAGFVARLRPKAA